MSEMHGTVMREAGAHGTPPRHPGRGRAALPLTPARRVALLIGVPVCLVLTGYAGLNIVALVAKGRFPVSHVFPASARQLSVSLGGGNAVLDQVTAGPARLSGSATYSFFRPNITEHVTADSAVFGYSCNTFPVGTCDLNATVSVPAGIAVTISTGGGDLTADHVADNLTLDTDGGNIQATGVAETRLAATSGGGDIEIVFTVVPRDVTVSTDGGNVTIVVPRGPTQYHVSAITAGGNVTDSTIPYNASSPNEITATSGGGDITIEQST